MAVHATGLGRGCPRPPGHLSCQASLPSGPRWRRASRSRIRAGYSPNLLARGHAWPLRYGRVGRTSGRRNSRSRGPCPTEWWEIEAQRLQTIMGVAYEASKAGAVAASPAGSLAAEEAAIEPSDR